MTALDSLIMFFEDADLNFEVFGNTVVLTAPSGSTVVFRCDEDGTLTDVEVENDDDE